MPVTVRVHYTGLGTGQAVPRGTVSAYPLDTPIILLDGTEQDAFDYVNPAIALDADGYAVVTLLKPSELASPSTHGWAVKLSDGIRDTVIYAGQVPEAAPSNHVASILDLTNLYGWGIVSGAQATPVVAVAGTPGVIWEGAWSSSTPYVPKQAVSYNGSSYIALASSTNVTPGTNGAVWGILAAGASSGFSDAATSSPGVVEIDHAPSGAHPVALTTDGPTASTITQNFVTALCRSFMGR